MGQYYRTILTGQNGYEMVYNRYVNCEYTMAKLMEHSWWCNSFVSTICSKIYKNPKKVVWVGDYADSADETNGIAGAELNRLCRKAWGGNGVGVKENLFYLDHRLLVNHTKKIYIDCDDYWEKSSERRYVIHPLPLLTVIGNGLGGGDYHGENMEFVGSWANDTISIEDYVPEGYKMITCWFKENLS